MPLVPKHITNLQPYKAGKSIEDLKKEFGLKKVVKLASNENPIGPSPRALEAVKKALAGVNRYPHPASPDLREALANRFDVKVDNVITGHGSEGIMSLIMRTFLLDDEEVLTSEGTFIGFRVLAQSRGVKMNTVPQSTDFRLDLSAIAGAITAKTKIIYLANPNNPTGSIFTVREFLNFYDKVDSHILIILDEAYFEFCYEEPKYPDSMKYRLDNVITLRTFSKAYGLAGIRIGYGFAHEDLIRNLMKVKLPFEPSIPAQVAGLAAMDDDDFLEKYLHLNERAIQFMYKLFDELGLNYIRSYANFVTLVLENPAKAQHLGDALLREGVIVRPLAAFGLPQCVRINSGTDEEMDFFAEKLKKVI